MNRTRFAVLTAVAVLALWAAAPAARAQTQRVVIDHQTGTATYYGVPDPAFTTYYNAPTYASATRPAYGIGYASYSSPYLYSGLLPNYTSPFLYSSFLPSYASPFLNYGPYTGQGFSSIQPGSAGYAGLPLMQPIIVTTPVPAYPLPYYYRPAYGVPRPLNSMRSLDYYRSIR